MKSIGILSYLVETDIDGKGKDTLLVEKGLLLMETCNAHLNKRLGVNNRYYSG
jgi:hypothetical protein